MSLKKYLGRFTKEQLIEQIIELEKKYKDVKTYYEFSLKPDSGARAEKIKNAIYKFFNSPRGYLPKLGEARKEIIAFKKLSPAEESLADVMLYYVECGTEFTLNYGDMNEQFYTSVAGMFFACDLIYKNGLRNQFQSRCKKIMDDSSDIAWGFHNEITDHYYSYFEH